MPPASVHRLLNFLYTIGFRVAQVTSLKVDMLLSSFCSILILTFIYANLKKDSKEVKIINKVLK